MIEALRLHTAVHLTCLRRNRLVQGFAVLVLASLTVALVPALVFDDDSNRFQALRQVARTLHGAVSGVTAALGVFLLWTHRRTRAITMVATTAAPFGAWVGSLFVTAALVGAAAQAVVALLVFTLSTVWGVTYQYGFVYLALDHLAESLIALAAFTVLGVRLHPVIAAALAMVINDSTLRTLRYGLELLPLGPLLTTVKAAATGLYYLLPASDPFGERTAALYRTMRVAESDWRYLLGTTAYALLALAFAQVTTLVLLRSKPRQ